MKNKCFACVVGQAVEGHLEGSAEEYARNIAIGRERWTVQTDFQGSGVGTIAEQSIADVQGEAIGSAADRHAETAPAWPAVIDNQRAESRIGDDE